MEIRKSIEEWIDSRPNAKLCLHNGFAGFSYGRCWFRVIKEYFFSKSSLLKK